MIGMNRRLKRKKGGVRKIRGGIRGVRSESGKGVRRRMKSRTGKNHKGVVIKEGKRGS